MAITSGQLYQHRQPALPDSFGQAAPPTTFRYEVDGKVYEWPYGTTSRASNTCDPQGGVANLGAATPLLRCSVIEAIGEEQFEHIPEPV